MELVLKKNLDFFLQYDEEFSKPLKSKDFSESVYTQWLKENVTKRYIYWKLYKDLLQSNQKTVLDVGGGITPYTPLLRKFSQNYTLCDILAHDVFLRPMVQDFLYEKDWFLMKPTPMNIIIANDLFPNADQRLKIFLDKFLPMCKEIRLTVTFYNETRFYYVQRLDAEEKLVLQAYNGAQCKNLLHEYKDRIKGFDEEKWNEVFSQPIEDSLYANKRHVLLLFIQGDLN